MENEKLKDELSEEIEVTEDKLDEIMEDIEEEQQQVVQISDRKQIKACIDVSSIEEAKSMEPKKGRADKAKEMAKSVFKKSSQGISKVAQQSKSVYGKTTQKMKQLSKKDSVAKDKSSALVEGETKEYNLFFVSDMEEEASYLHTMSMNGKHFLRKSGIQYIFQTGEAKNYYYHLGYYEKDKRDGDRYDKNYEDAGWSKIYHEKGEFDGVWNYFRTEIAEGETAPEIFSDRISRVALYERLLSSWRSLLAMIVICLIFMAVFLYVLNSKVGRISSIVLVVCILISIVFLLILAIYSKIYLKIKKKLVELKK